MSFSFARVFRNLIVESPVRVHNVFGIVDHCRRVREMNRLRSRTRLSAVLSRATYIEDLRYNPEARCRTGPWTPVIDDYLR